MKRFLLTTASAALIGGAALAQTAAVPMTESPYLDEAVTDSIYASQFIGKAIYVSETEVVDTPVANAATDWTSIGSINDVVIGKTGEVEAVLVDVGGFLGIGARTVAVNMGSLRLVTDSDTAGDYFVVFRSNRADLEAAPGFAFPETMASTSVAPAGMAADTAAEMATITGAAAGTAASTMGSAAGGTWMTPAEGYMPVSDRATLTAAQLEGAKVYDRADKDVGSVASLVMNASGHIDQAVVDVGGFLGIGAKPVALNFNDLEIHKQTDGETYRVYLNMTKEQLEALPAHDS